MIIKELIKHSSLPQPESEQILAFLLKKEVVWIITHIDSSININIVKKFKSLEIKRKANWPIAYLIGQKNFHNYVFNVTPNVLIPRPETEILINLILEEITATTNKEKPPIFNFLDVGTGSGAIIITLAMEIKKKYPKLYKNSSFTATDISDKALKVARLNAKKYNISKKIKFYKTDLINNLPANIFTENLVITANLPYLTPKQIKDEISIKHEPKLALDGGLNGLKYYRQLFKKLSKISFNYLDLYNEIDPDQSKTIEELAKTYFHHKNIITSIKKDLRKQKRFLAIYTRKRN